MARDNGSTADLHLNPDGGAVSFNNSVSTKVRIQDGHITASGGISASGVSTATSFFAKNTDLGSSFSLFDADGNNVAFLARQGSGTNAHRGRLGLRDNATTKVEFKSSGDSYINGGGNVGIGTDSPNTNLEVVGNISASGEVEGLSGSFSVLVGDTSQGTSLEVDGPVTGSAFRGTKHILRNETIYINDNPFVQNSLYFGNSLGNQPNNWNDPQATGGTISSVSSFTIAEDDMNWGYILPFDISAVEIQCSLRPALGNGDDFTLVLYTANRSSASNTVITLTKVAVSQTTFSASNYKTNDLTHTANLDKGTMIFVGIGSEDATDAKNARGLLNITITAR